MAQFRIFMADPAKQEYQILKSTPSLEKRYRAVKKCIKFLASNPRHPGLQTHEYTNERGPGGEKVFEAYAEQKTAAAYRVFWYYGPEKGQITIIAITPHP